MARHLFCLLALLVHVATVRSQSPVSPVLLWTFSDSHRSEYVALKQQFEASLVGSANVSDDKILSQLKDQLTNPSSKLHDHIVVLFLDKGIDTQTFLRLSGAFGTPDQQTCERLCLRYASLLQALQEAPFSVMREDTRPASFGNVIDLMKEVAGAKSAKPVAFLSSEAVPIVNIPEEVEVLPIASTPLSALVSTAGLVVVDVSSLKTWDTGSFILEFLRGRKESQAALGGEGVPSIVALWMSTLEDDSDENDTPVKVWEEGVSFIAQKQRMLQESNNGEELRIEPFQLTVLLTLLFVFSMILLVVCCLANIDIPIFFEEKTLQINKEY